MVDEVRASPRRRQLVSGEVGDERSSASPRPMTPHGLNVEELRVAQRNLAKFVQAQAEAAKHRLGFGWRASSSHHPRFSQLYREHRASDLSGLPLRVSSLHCENSIFGSHEANHAMRFWHDTSHVRLRLGFSADDEMELGCHHLEVLRSEGFQPTSLEHRLLHADTLGQVLCSATIGHFPDDQLQFALTAVQHGIDAAIEEAKCTSAPDQLVGRGPQSGAKIAPNVTAVGQVCASSRRW